MPSDGQALSRVAYTRLHERRGAGRASDIACRSSGWLQHRQSTYRSTPCAVDGQRAFPPDARGGLRERIETFSSLDFTRPMTIPVKTVAAHPSMARPELWIADIAAIAEPRAAEACYRLLDEGERRRNARFRRAEDRHRDLLARALVRTVLSTYVPVAPERWRFERDVHGRPSACEPYVADLHFSLSHAGSLVACVVAREPRIGVDVEAVHQRLTVPSALALRERRALRSLPSEAFFAFWTLREAYTKALGVGLAGSSDEVWFELKGKHGAVLFECEAMATGWWFHRLAPAHGYVLAVALRTAPDAQPRLIRRGAPPLPYA